MTEQQFTVRIDGTCNDYTHGVMDDREFRDSIMDTVIELVGNHLPAPLRLLSEMTADDYRQMIADVHGEEMAARYPIYKAHYMHLKEGKRLNSFAGCDGSGKQLMGHDLARILSDSFFCDWLDYKGFARPRWAADGKSVPYDACNPVMSY
ncbi:hypothetical protein GGR92_000025 [Spirosoma lacussanchae]|uniref:hypothetical protein n=1 Tax=Spirosoma lacussanchae TaxID=1884249 RepID=UPI00110985B9|nr:hypothetical protein [Spirosoma lacussanchae]